MELEELMTPARVSLDSDAIELYKTMRESERLFVDVLRDKFGARVWRQQSADDGDEFVQNATEGRRRFIALVPERNQDAFLARWPNLVRGLQEVRDQMLATIKALAHEQDVHAPGAGEQTTSAPLLIDGVCTSVTYTVNQAFRAGTIDEGDIGRFLMRREQQLNEYIAKAADQYKHERVANYTSRLAELNDDIERFEALSRQHRLIARVMSGHGTRVRFSRERGDGEQITLQHIAVAIASPSCNVKRASYRQRESKYGPPLATLASSLLLYAA